MVSFAATATLESNVKLDNHVRIFKKRQRITHREPRTKAIGIPLIFLGQDWVWLEDYPSKPCLVGADWGQLPQE